MNVLKTLRNHWKKSIFFGGVLSYGASYGYDKYRCVDKHELIN